MADNRVSKRRRQPPRRAKAKLVDYTYAELNSDDIGPVTPARPTPPPVQDPSPTPPLLQDPNPTPPPFQNPSPSPPPFQDPSPEPPIEVDSSSETAHDSPAPAPAQRNTTPGPARDDTISEAGQGDNTPADDQNNENSPTPEEPSMEASSEFGTPPPGEFDHPNSFRPEFWNSLSRTYLTKRSLRELDRRNEDRPDPKLERPTKRPKSITHWAMYGGPNTRHLRGYQGPNMPKPIGPRKKILKRRHLRADPLSAYDPNLGQWLYDHGIYMVNKGTDENPKFPSNVSTIIDRIHQPFPALGPKNFTEAHFKRWKAQDAKAQPNELMGSVFRIILGGNGGLRARNVQLKNLAPIAGKVAPVVPGPTAFDASPEDSINGVAKSVLEDKIVPVALGEFVAPNFFLEASGAKGVRTKDIEERRACYHGAMGARAMQALQNIAKEGDEVVYDGKARAFSATYVESELSLYAHHVSRPKVEGGKPEYHMTYLGSWDLRKSRKRWADGVGAFRNLLELAAEVRGEMVDLVNYTTEGTPEGSSGKSSIAQSSAG